MRIITNVAKLLAVLFVVSTLSFTAVADSHGAGESADADEVETTEAPPVDAAPPESDEAGDEAAETEQD